MEYKVWQVTSVEEFQDLLMDGWIAQGSFQLKGETCFILMRNVIEPPKE